MLLATYQIDMMLLPNMPSISYVITFGINSFIIKTSSILRWFCLGIYSSIMYVSNVCTYIRNVHTYVRMWLMYVRKCINNWNKKRANKVDGGPFSYVRTYYVCTYVMYICTCITPNHVYVNGINVGIKECVLKLNPVVVDANSFGNMYVTNGPINGINGISFGNTFVN